MGNPKDFTARQIRTSQLIASGGMDGTSVGLIVYSASISSDMRGGFAKDPDLLADVGEDVYFFVSGSIDSMVKDGSGWTPNGDQGTTVFGGDLFVSGNFEWAGASNTSGWTEAANWLHPTDNGDRIGIGTAADDPVSKVKIKHSPPVDTTGAALRADSNYQIILRNDTAVDDRWAGIGFEIDNSVSENTTAAILAKRTGANGQGNLEFFVKSSAALAAVPSQRMSINEAFSLTGSMFDIGDLNSDGSILRLTTHDSNIQNGDMIGTIEFYGMDSESNGLGAKIVAEATQQWGLTNDHPTELQFWTTPNGVGNPALKRVVIDRDGKVGIGIASLGTEMFNVQGDVVLNGTNVDVAKNIRHVGNTTTLIEFETDRIVLQGASENLVQIIGGEGVGINNDSLDRSITIKTADRLAFGAARMGPTLDGVNQSIVLILSGGGDPTEHGSDPQKMTDVGFFVSGSIDSKGTSVRGTALFGGDLQVSGTIYGTLGNPVVSAGGWTDDGSVVRLTTIGDQVGIGLPGTGEFAPGTGVKLAVRGGDTALSGTNVDVSQFIRHIGDADTYLEFTDNKFSLEAGGIKGIQFDQSESVISLNNEAEEVTTLIKTPDRLAFGSTRIGPPLDGSNQSIVLILSGGGNPVTSPDPQKMTDVGFYVSGSVGSRGTSVRGTSLFDGDVVISGALNGGSPLQVGEHRDDLGVDVSFYVSGSAGSAGSGGNQGGTSLFGGDVFVSGNMFVTEGDDSAGSGPKLFLGRDSTSPASSDVMGRIQWSGKNDANEWVQYARIDGIIVDPTDSDEDGKLQFRVMHGGIPRDILTLQSGQILFNGQKRDIDFKVSSDDKDNALYVDAGQNQVLILSGGADHDPDFNVATWSDTNFFVSGTIGSRGTAIKGTSVFGGDLQVSGTIYGTIAGGTSAGGWTDDGSVIRLTTTNDQVGIGLPSSGDTAPGDGVKLAVRGGDTVLSGTNLDVAQSIRHIGDPDTFIEFGTDKITFDAGGESLFKLNGGEGASVNPDSLDRVITMRTADRFAWVSGRISPPLDGSNQSVVLILSGGSPTSTNEAASTDVGFYVSGSIGSRGTSIRGTSVFGGDVVISGSLSNDVINRITNTVSFSNIVSSAQTIDTFSNASGFRGVKYTIGGKPDGSDDRLFSEFIVVNTTSGNTGAPSTTETRVYSDNDTPGSEFMNESNVAITATKAAGVVSIKIKGTGPGADTFQINNSNLTGMEISFERLVILD